MKITAVFVILFLSLSLLSCKKDKRVDQPNIILIMADDMGYECLGTYGSTSYETPVLDNLASKGIQFNNCVSQPLCTPSRVKMMTGLYNYRNYDYFGHLGTQQYTFGNLLQEAGYATCIAGKWQLNGLAYKDEIPDWNDQSKPHKLGFDEYCLWQLTQTANLGGRYADPLIEQNGELLTRNPEAYGPDIFSDYILDFIQRKKETPFFVYYPMVLVHDPFVPTPESAEWEDPTTRHKKDTCYFKEMVAYTDKIVGKITSRLKELQIDNNTIVIFTGDNGTHPSIFSQTQEGVIRGGKGNTIDAGTHVPLIVSWPACITKGFAFDGLIEFSDFFPTFADLVNKTVKSDGYSFLPLLRGEKYRARETALVHYDPKWGKNVNRYRNRFIRTLHYKLYQDGRFFNLDQDILEKSPLADDSLLDHEKNLKRKLEDALKKHPLWKDSE